MRGEDLRAQYEAYPYPARDPADERRRLVTGSPSHLDELNHFGFGGRLDFSRPFRVLVAGGGTGDATIMLAQQARDAGIPAEILHLDLSDASRAIAEARARVRGLDSVSFERGSLLELGGRGPFDYIDCCGVLHHLEDPAAGLRSLAGALAPGGAMGVMVYGTYGRSGLYPLQEALRQLGAELAPAARVAQARRLLERLPPTNGFRRNPFLGDHRQSDAGLYDLLLHSRDRAYTVPELAALVEECGLAVAALVEPMRYAPETWIKDPALLAPLRERPWLERAAFAERVAGSLTKHVAYLTRPGDAAGAVARPDGPDTVPVLRDLDGPALAKGLRPGASLDADLAGLTLSLALPRLAGPILARIDGRTPLGAIHEQLRALDGALGWDAFKAQFDALYAPLNGLAKLLLRNP
ncbi:methyltransferase [Arenibaculum pallidiluteum]|uniref:methyltransferase n=1 Tax=Arenibaculum pallidiluteum TaxID=2812559 RepID=UPI001A963592|nr:methyltransferase [Arenibaculum pallidiluteum]